MRETVHFIRSLYQPYWAGILSLPYTSVSPHFGQTRLSSSWQRDVMGHHASLIEGNVSRADRSVEWLYWIQPRGSSRFMCGSCAPCHEKWGPCELDSVNPKVRCKWVVRKRETRVEIMLLPSHRIGQLLRKWRRWNTKGACELEAVGLMEKTVRDKDG